MLVVNCVVSLLLGLITVTFTSLSIYQPLREFSGCRMTTCLSYTMLFSVILQASIYFTVVLTYVAVYVFVNKTNRRREGTPSGSQSFGTSKQINLQKLALSIANYALFHGLVLAASTYISIDYTNGCSVILDSYNVFLLNGCMRLLLTMRTIVDPIISFLADKTLRDRFLKAYASFALKF